MRYAFRACLTQLDIEHFRAWPSASVSAVTSTVWLAPACLVDRSPVLYQWNVDCFGDALDSLAVHTGRGVRFFRKFSSAPFLIFA